MTAPSMLGLGTSALSAYRSALSVTSNNISNVGVDGYSRQRADLNMQDAMRTNQGYMGTGVEGGQVTRVYDQFLTKNLNTATSSANHYNSYHEYASTIDEILANPEMGMTPVMSTFFNAMHDLTAAPSSIPARQVLQGEGEALVTRFNTLHSEMETVRSQTLEEMDATVSRINGISMSIADLNAKISNASNGGNEPPNDLLDRRDQLTKELAEYVGITTNEQEGMVNIYIGKGQALVADTSYNELTLGSSQYNQSETFKLYMKMGQTDIDITSAIKGGRAGGIVDFTKDILTTAQNSLGRMAIAISATINAQHRSGYGMNGDSDTGNNFFSLGETTSVDGITKMTLDGAIAETDSSALLSVSIPLNNGEVEVGPVTANAVTGLTLNGTLIGDVAAGATATATAASIVDAINAESSETGITAEATSDDKIKLISDQDIEVTVADSGDISASGLSEGTYRMVKSSIKALTTDDYALSYNGTSFVITNQNTQEERVLDTAETTQLKDTSIRGGVVHDGLVFQLNTYQGEMEEGEEIVVHATRNASQNIGMALTAAQIASIAASDQPDESGNNQNMLDMVALQTEKLLSAGSNGVATATFQENYGQLVSEVGVQTHYADVNRVAQESIVKNAQASRDNHAAVNLDEEAANLLKFQQMYQASTRVISMADELFKAVLNVV